MDCMWWLAIICGEIGRRGEERRGEQRGECRTEGRREEEDKRRACGWHEVCGKWDESMWMKRQMWNHYGGKCFVLHRAPSTAAEINLSRDNGWNILTVRNNRPWWINKDSDTLQSRVWSVSKGFIYEWMYVHGILPLCCRRCARTTQYHLPTEIKTLFRS